MQSEHRDPVRGLCAITAALRGGAIQTDNGAELQTSFPWHVLDKGINHVYIKPRTPRLNGKVERSHRIDAEEFYRLLDGVVIDDTNLFNTKLKEWEDYYNYHRPCVSTAAYRSTVTRPETSPHGREGRFSSVAARRASSSMSRMCTRVPSVANARAIAQGRSHWRWL